MATTIGILALQGDFARHGQAFEKLGVQTRLVRRGRELDGCDGLVIPGGESTTLSRLCDRCDMRQPIMDFAATGAVMGTCAGLILLADSLEEEVGGHHGVVPLGLLPCHIRRNGFGRQVDSFTEGVSIERLDGSEDLFPAVYIRAPRILETGSPDCEIVASRGDEAVAVRYGRILGLTFHPELTSDTRIHAVFAAMAGSD